MSIVKNQTISLADYKPHSQNYNKHSDAQLAKLQASLSKFGQVRSIVVWREYIIAGHGLTEAAKRLGWKSLRADVLDSEISESVALAYLVADNELARQSDPDQAALAAILDQVKQADAELVTAAGFSEQELGELLASLEPASEPVDAPAQVDRAEELQAVWNVQPGDIFAIGEHRLICGDCTDNAVVARLMQGERSNLLFTSPPYWVGKDYETQNTEKEIDDFISSCVKAWTDAVDVDCGRIVINTGSAAIHRIEKKRRVEVLPLIDKWQKELRQRGWLARHWRIWAKGGDFPASISPKTDVVDQHWEHIVSFDNEFSFLGTWWAPTGEQRGQERVGTPWAQQGVWSDIQGQRSGEGSHIAAFPLELPSRYLKLYTKPEEIVLEPFGGSGTTGIACENLKRKARMIEISPAYCAVILQRMKDATGITGVRVEA